MASHVQDMRSFVDTLDSIFSPLTTNEFVDKFFGKSFLYLPGPTGKFNNLLPWNALNQILSEHRLAPPRLNLFQSGKPVSTDKYLSTAENLGPRVRSAELTNLLAEGATLVINAIDELHWPVREIAAALERFFRINVQVNLYAGWRTDQGFLLHYDPHDTLIFQIAGRKHWRVYRPTRLYPLEQGKDAESAEKPVEEPVWDQLLEDGGLIYMPRGWWHVAFPVDEPTLHLTAGLRNHRGLDMLLWFVNQLKDHAEVRQDVPFLSTQRDRTTYMKDVRTRLSGAWTDDLIDRFLSAAEAKAFPRPYFQLPESAMPTGVALHRESRVRLTGARISVLPATAGSSDLTLHCSGKTLHCGQPIAPAIERINDGGFHSVTDLVALAPNQDTMILSLLQVLVLQGIIALAPTNRKNPAEGK